MMLLILHILVKMYISLTIYSNFLAVLAIKFFTVHPPQNEIFRWLAPLFPKYLLIFLAKIFLCSKRVAHVKGSVQMGTARKFSQK